MSLLHKRPGAAWPLASGVVAASAFVLSLAMSGWAFVGHAPIERPTLQQSSPVSSGYGASYGASAAQCRRAALKVLNACTSRAGGEVSVLQQCRVIYDASASQCGVGGL